MRLIVTIPRVVLLFRGRRLKVKVCFGIACFGIEDIVFFVLDLCCSLYIEETVQAMPLQCVQMCTGCIYEKRPRNRRQCSILYFTL
ncbi:unnamed protein product [Ixodes pacificus]